MKWMWLVLAGCWTSAVPAAYEPHPERVVRSGGANLVAVDDTGLYWARTTTIGGVVWRVDKIPGSTPRKLVDTAGVVSGLALDADHVYIGAGLQVQVVPKSGTGERVISAGTTPVTSVALRERRLDVAVSEPTVNGPVSRLIRATPDGEQYASLALEGADPHVVEAASYAYVATREALYRVSSNVAALVTKSDIPITSLAAYGDDLYLATDRVLHVVGTNAFDLCSAGGPVSAMIVDDRYVYWSAPGVVYRVPKSGGTREPIAKVGQVTSFAIDGPYLYWADQGKGKIVRVLR